MIKFSGKIFIFMVLLGVYGSVFAETFDSASEYKYREVTIGDTTVEYMERQPTIEELANLAPAAGLNKDPSGPFTGPRVKELQAEVWATQDFE
jgi:hypothetical protein